MKASSSAAGERTYPYDPGLNSAAISECGRYRYALSRAWGEGPRALFIMLNPSTADSSEDDPTLLACVDFSKRWGFAGVDLVNLFAWRSSEPMDLLTARDPVGPWNDVTLNAALGDKRIGRVVAAWGTSSKKALRDRIEARAFAVRTIIRRGPARDVRCLGTTKDGKPRHPLYIARELAPAPYPV